MPENKAKRKPIGAKMRFEVFKRDCFTCQYCGKRPPEAVLEVDHIKPVCNGGTNTMINLVTSCFECNRGKGKRSLDDNSAVVIQNKELAVKEQMRMMLKWKEELIELEFQQIDFVCNYISSVSQFDVSQVGKQKISSLISRFGFDEVVESTKISFSKYYSGSDRSWDVAFEKIGGIAYNRKKNREG